MKKTTIGGQALIEGIIMRGPYKSCTVVRKPDKTLDITEKTHKKGIEWLKKIPVLRGIYGLATSLSEGTKALNYSATVSGFEDDEEPSKLEKWLTDKFGQKKIEKFILSLSMVFAVIISVGLFILLPSFLGGFVSNISDNHFLRNITEGVVRIIIFLIYMYLMSKIEDIKRTYMYHGAEHKAIYCYEKNLDLTVENVRSMPKEHPRCGTSFLFVVMIISILVFSVVTYTDPIIRTILKIVLIPVVVGLSYEVNRFAGRYDNLFTQILRYPGIKLQKLTTIEPDDSMIEVAIEALKRVIPENKESDNW